MEKDGDRDYWMTADEAKEYGIIDDVLEKNPKKKAVEKITILSNVETSRPGGTFSFSTPPGTGVSLFSSIPGMRLSFFTSPGKNA